MNSPEPNTNGANERQIGDAIWSLFASASRVDQGTVDSLMDSELPYLRARLGELKAQRVLHEVRAMLSTEGDLLIERELAASAGSDLELENEASHPAGFGAPRIDGYRMKALIGEGGMSDVWLAERGDASFEQRLAVKVLRRGLLHPEMVARFERERDLLLQLDHPAIVTLIDAGTTHDGRPYLVLPFVEGEPITIWCAVRSRHRVLELMIELCRAVQFAHGKLVVHRDLKPSNVMLTADGQLRLMDFGVAKLLAASHDPAVGTAEHARAPMTRGRAAPEQRAGGEISTATDVWALGVLLHELLTGELPVLDQRGAVANLRCNGLEGDLIQILHRCLQSEATDRYPSAAHLADDLERYLACRPITARRRTLPYVLSLLVRRNRIAVGTASVLATAVIVLTAATLLQARSLVDERNRAQALRENAEASLQVLTQLLEEGDPVTGEPRPAIEVKRLLARAEATTRRLRDQPVVQAQLRNLLGQLHAARGEPDAGRELLVASLDAYRRELGADSPEALKTELDLVSLEHRLHGDHEATLREAQRLLDLVAPLEQRRPLLAAQAYRLAGGFRADDEGEQLVLRAADIFRAHGETRKLANAVSSLIVVRLLRGNRTGARQAATEGLSLYRELDGASGYMSLVMQAHLASLIDDPEERLAAQRKVLDQRIELLGDEHQHVGNSYLQLGNTLREMNRLDEAIEALRRAESATAGTSLYTRAVKQREYAEHLLAKRAGASD